MKPKNTKVKPTTKPHKGFKTSAAEDKWADSLQSLQDKLAAAKSEVERLEMEIETLEGLWHMPEGDPPMFEQDFASDEEDDERDRGMMF